MRKIFKRLQEMIHARRRFIIGMIAPSKFEKSPIWISSTPSPFNNPSKLSAEIYRRFQHFGTDKSSNHLYHFPYSFVLGRLGKSQAMLEIGIGSTKSDIPFNMSWKKNYKPGASLFAWRDLGVFSKIIGADIDPVQFEFGQNLECLFVDQTSRESLLNLAEQLRERGLTPLDLIVDDGIHQVEYNLMTFETLFGTLRSRGMYVIEDLKQRDLWPIIARLRELGFLNWHLWINPAEGENCSMLIIEMN